MSEQSSSYVTTRIEDADSRSGFRCGKHPSAEGFYSAYGFVTVDVSHWPRRMFVALATVREALGT
jgi:hypothetical protein